MYFSRKDAGVMRRMLDNWPSEDAEIVVVTDGGRVLGLGVIWVQRRYLRRQGVPHAASGGFDPAKSMPVCLDLGTNNEGLRARLLSRRGRAETSGEAHMAVVEEFCLAIKDKWPNCLIQSKTLGRRTLFEFSSACVTRFYALTMTFKAPGRLFWQD